MESNSMMAGSSQRKSARIYQFPVGGRRGRVEQRPASPETVAQQLPRIAVGGAWYHEAAIQETPRALERP